MDGLLPAYKAVGERRYRETSGLYWEDFEPGDIFEHRPGRTVLDMDNTYFTLLTLNVQQVHFDAAYAAKTEWKKMLVDSTFTLALLTGMSVRTVSAKVVANLGWDKVKATHPVFAGDTLYAETATTAALWDALIRLTKVSKFVAPAGPKASTLLERNGHEAGDRVCATAIELK
jgi:itaconyl-CoA hydratase